MIVAFTYSSGVKASREVADIADVDTELSGARSLIRFLRCHGNATARTDRNVSNLLELADALLDARNELRGGEVAALEAVFALPCLEATA